MSFIQARSLMLEGGTHLCTQSAIHLVECIFFFFIYKQAISGQGTYPPLA
jgi:hypothetical protein